MILEDFFNAFVAGNAFFICFCGVKMSIYVNNETNARAAQGILGPVKRNHIGLGPPNKSRYFTKKYYFNII